MLYILSMKAPQKRCIGRMSYKHGIEIADVE
jgi:hypothetical protein